jgi:hypothetical protein
MTKATTKIAKRQIAEENGVRIITCQCKPARSLGDLSESSETKLERLGKPLEVLWDIDQMVVRYPARAQINKRSSINQTKGTALDLKRKGNSSEAPLRFTGCRSPTTSLNNRPTSLLKFRRQKTTINL